MAQSNAQWIEVIAERAKTEIPAVEAVLTKHHIRPTPVLASPRRLTIVEIAFSGVKDGVADSGPFEFLWGNLDHGLWAMLTDQNLRGKSTVMEVVRWLLRGRPSSNLQEDVRRWIRNARVRFLLDDLLHEVNVQTTHGVSGSLLRLGKAQRQGVEIGTFSSERDFEAVMTDFFMAAFAMEAIMTWRGNGTPDDIGQAVAHGWPAFSGAMFIGTNYEVLLGDMPVGAGLSARLMQMYLGLPWVSTLASARTAQQSAQSAADSRARNLEQGTNARQARIKQIDFELEGKRSQLQSLPSDQFICSVLSASSVEIAARKREELELRERYERETSALRQADSARKEDQRSLQEHLDSMAAGQVFRMLDPTCCPRCDHEIDKQRKEHEKATHMCSVCGLAIQTNDDAELMRSELEERLKASKTAYDSVCVNQQKTEHRLDELKKTIQSIETEIDKNTKQLGTFDRRQQLRAEISVLEGRLEEARFIPEQQRQDNGHELAILNSIATETENRVKAFRDSILNDVSSRLVQYAQRFGMHNLSAATLKANAALLLTKGGSATSYSKVTEGEKLRLKVATVLAMIETAEKRGVGRHPGLLMIDSPAAQEVSQDDLDQLVLGLQSISEEIPHLQVFVSGMSSPAITQHVPAARRRESLNGGFLW
jgi:hypothetical protein